MSLRIISVSMDVWWIEDYPQIKQVFLNTIMPI